MNLALPGFLGRLGRSVRSERHLRRAALLTVLVLVVGIFLFRERLLGIDVRNIAYGGVFALSLIGSASILVPAPWFGAVYWGGAYLNPVVVGLLAGVAEAIGELSGYLLGFSGSSMATRYPRYEMVERWMHRRGGTVVFVMSIVPNPLFDVVGVVAGGSRFPVWRFLVAAWLGKTLKDLGIAYAGYFSVPLLLRLYEGWFG